jgi:hypothetical protein
MPTQEELEGVYDKGKTYKSDCGNDVHLTELIRLSRTWAWTSVTRGIEAAFFGFDGVGRCWTTSVTDSGRVLPVRSGK